MKLVRWKRFTWDLTKLPPHSGALPAHYTVRAATRDEHKLVKSLVFRAFSLDTDWSDSFSSFHHRMEAEIDHAFAHETAPALVIAHGQRIIAASAISSAIDAENHLLTGPCVLMEYRSRGIGSTLLHRSLEQLGAAGLSRVVGVCKHPVPTSKFVYPKFGALSEVYDFEPSAVPS